YLQAVRTILGYKNGFVCGCLVYFSIFKTGVVYTLTCATSMRAILQSNCYHKEGHDAACEFENKYYMLMFGIVQIVVSQIPNIFHTKWLSIIAAVMSFTYSFIGMGLGL
nr:probable amino acid permease 7 [Tanacetum cinerariifolium]